MSQHPDDGTIQMLLDEELDRAERTQVESHLAGCEACAARVSEARAFQREADRLVTVLQVPAAPARVPARRRSRPSLLTMAWAASVLLAVSLGYWGRGGVSPAPPASELEPEDMPSLQQASGGEAKDGAAQRVAAPPAVASAVPQREASKQVAQPTAPPLAAAKPAPLDANADFAGTPDRNAASTWRLLTMEEAVRLLGGQIRLIDGLDPDRLETGPGTAVPGAAPGQPIVRVVYAEGAVVLDQQRPAMDELRREAASEAVAKAARTPAAAPGLLSQATAWREQAGIRFVVTGSVSADSLATLTGRVR